MSNFRNLMRFDAKSPKSQADELRRWSRQFNRSQSKFQTKLAEQTIASPEQGISCDKCNIATVVPPDEQAVTVSSTCHDSPEPEIKCDTVVAKSELTDCDQHETAAVQPCEKPPVIASSTCPEPEIKCDKVGKCDAAASVLLYDGPATITSSARPACPDTSCDRRQDASQVRVLGTGSDNVKEP